MPANRAQAHDQVVAGQLAAFGIGGDGGEAAARAVSRSAGAAATNSHATPARPVAGFEARTTGDGRAPFGSQYRFGMLPFAAERWQGRGTGG